MSCNGDLSQNELPFALKNGERAKKIKSFEDYIITSQGRCYSTKTNRFIGSINKKTSYVQLVLMPIQDKTRYMHDLVMLNFGPPKPKPGPDGKPYEVNHIDTNPTNNDVNNLEWVPHRENLLKRNPYTENRKQRLTKAEMEEFNRWYIENYDELKLDTLSNQKIADLVNQILGIDINQQTVRINKNRWTIDENNKLIRI